MCFEKVGKVEEKGRKKSWRKKEVEKKKEDYMKKVWYIYVRYWTVYI